MVDGPDKGEGPEDKEDALWRHVKEATRLLSGRKRAMKANPPQKGVRPPAVPPSAAPSVASTPPPSRLKAGGLGRGGLDGRTAERLRRGRLPIAATLDLHGLTQAEAHRVLNSYLLRAQNAGKRMVLVITGKGIGKEGGGVLRANVPRWLDEPPLSKIVLEIAPARGRHGGGGAFYVLLRKQKQNR